jgi:hypothetical protein
MNIPERPDSEFQNRPARREARMSSDGHQCFSEAGIKTLDKRHGLMMTLVADFGREQRLFHEVIVGDRAYLVDHVTGSMYYMDGRSASGSWMRVEV